MPLTMAGRCIIGKASECVNAFPDETLDGTMVHQRIMQGSGRERPSGAAIRYGGTGGASDSAAAHVAAGVCVVSHLLDDAGTGGVGSVSTGR